VPGDVEEAQGLSLDELLERARSASGLDLEDWRQPIVAHGVDAIDAIKPWLTLQDQRLGWFAVTVIAWVGRAGHADDAVTALREARAQAPARVKQHIREALGELSTDEFLVHGRRLAPSYLHPETIFHIIVDQVPGPVGPWSNIYLAACGWAYDDEGLSSLGGIVGPEGRVLCSRCRDLENGL
jgi:hypothetical protein